MKKNTIILLLLFVVLLGAAYLVTMKPGEQSVSSDEGEPVVEVDSAMVDKIEIRAPLSSVVLVKRGSEWFLEQPISYKANQANVTSAIKQARDMKVKNVVSTNAEKHGMFEVDSTGTSVTLYENGEQAASFILGKTGPAFSDSYARLASSNDVLLVGDGQSFVFNKALKEWRDRTIFTAPKETITEIAFQYGNERFMLAFKDSVWMVGGDPADDNTVQSFLTSLSKIEADEFVDTAPTLLPKLTAQIAVSSTQLRFHEASDKSKYYVQSSASPQWYELQNWRVNQLLKRKSDFVKK
ncbi:MAG: DUF4340 domain-containing protein [Ignavibacteriae bacterium]|nr:DUF4340 domain-containing protein [Ignavibacteriota bacterium]